MVTQTIHVGDCELLERWADAKVLADPLSAWRTWVNRTAIEGMNASAIIPNPYAAVMPYMPTPGSTECINGWRGLSPLALNPHFGTAPGYNPAVHGPVEWTHWADLVTIYGTDETGFARSPWDNVGVQYGLAALQAGTITPAQFLDLNANVGSWKRSADMVQEGCPFIAALCASQLPDVWSARNMQLSPDGGATPAARREGNKDAGHAAYRSGMVFRGKLDIPVIDWRHYLEAYLDMHNSHQSFAARQRLLNYDGDASNQLVWFTAVPPPGTPGARFDQTPQAFLVLDEWIKNIQANPQQERREEQAGERRRRVLRRERPADRDRQGRLERDPRQALRRGLHAGVPALRHLPHRRGRADRGRRLQVRAPAGVPRDRARRLRLVAADARGVDAPAGDLPGGRLRLREGRSDAPARPRAGSRRRLSERGRLRSGAAALFPRWNADFRACGVASVAPVLRFD